MNENTAPEYARLFAARIERQGLFKSRLDAFMDTDKTVFVRVVLCPDLPTARLAAERALNAATWASARAAGTGSSAGGLGILPLDRRDGGGIQVRLGSSEFPAESELSCFGAGKRKNR